MKRIDCEFESEALAAALQSRWPERVDAGLRAHVAGCEICSSVVAIAGAIDEAREETRASTALPDSGRVWWVAQMRARREAAQAAARPITAIQVLALASAVGLLGACFGATSTWFQSGLAKIASGMAGIKLHTLVPSAMALFTEHGALVLIAAALLVVVPAVCLAMLRE